MSIARLAALLLALVALAAGCGGDDEPKSEEDKIGDVAKQYVHSASNNEVEKCRETLASGVDPKLCGDLEPLVARNNPEVKKEAKITGSTAKVTVTGAGPTLLEIEVVKQGGDWKVRSWKGYAAGQEPHGGPGDPSSGGAAPPDTTEDSGSDDSGDGY